MKYVKVNVKTLKCKYTEEILRFHLTRHKDITFIYLQKLLILK